MRSARRLSSRMRMSTVEMVRSIRSVVVGMRTSVGGVQVGVSTVETGSVEIGSVEGGSGRSGDEESGDDG